MEISNKPEKRKHVFYQIIIIAYFALAILLTILIFSFQACTIVLNVVFSSIILIMLLMAFGVFWLYHEFQMKNLEIKSRQTEIENKHKFEQEQAALNHQYRLESLKVEKSKEFLKLYDGKKDKKQQDGQDNLNVNTSIAKYIAELIKEFKQEINKTS